MMHKIQFKKYLCLAATLVIGCFLLPAHSNSIKSDPAEANIYQWMKQPAVEQCQANRAAIELAKAIQNPEYMLDHWIDLPTSPEPRSNKATLHLTLREAILLALRYNPSIQNAELDRIIQRYQLRLAHNEFELQYALAGTAFVEKSRYSGVGSTTSKNYLVTPEVDLKTKWGTQLSLMMDNNVGPMGNYNPLVGLNFTQPLLRGFGRAANEAGLLNAEDLERLNKVNLQQAVMDQITQVIATYHALIASGNNLENQRLQLNEANKSLEINQQKIRAGQIEPAANVQLSYQIESLRLMVEQAENDFRTTAQDLLQTIGLDPDMKLAVPSDVQLKRLLVPDLKTSILQGLNHNAQYLALKIGLRADQRAYEAAKNQQLWQLDFNANVQAGTITGVDNNARGLPNIYNGRNLTEAAGLTLTIPFNDVNNRSQLINAKVKLEKDRVNLLAARRALITNIKNTISNIESQAKRYELAQKQVALAQQSYRLEKKKQQAGISTPLDVNNTQNQLLLAQMGLIHAKISYLNQLSSLQRLIGTTLEHWKIKLRYC